MTGVSNGDATDPLGRLRVQLRRAQEYFAPTIDPAASARAAFEARAFVESHLADLQAQADAALDRTVVLDGEPLPVWSYWDGPEASAPALVRACLAQLRRVHPEARVLDAETVSEFVRLPAVIEERLAHRPAQRSDLIRVSLLERHGGIWVDATAFVPEPLTPKVEPLLDAGSFYLRWAANEISNWFIVARPGNRLIALQRAALEAWWRERDELPDYFLYHRLFTAIVSLDAGARRIARAMPRRSTVPSHLLQLAMLRPYDADEVALILGAALVQKLSYKYDPDAVPAGSILDRLLAGQLQPRR
ncbi:capsular polysaccharide synthesis protein [Agromyces sp. NPDC056379]|uniref:capsular polysaccharide synthesis protein n=1 Tax=unclassified Agromyces TaxID=2639701 RepID=UPI0035DE7B06